MTEIATIDWFGRWGTSVFSENTAIFFSLSFQQYNNRSVNLFVLYIFSEFFLDRVVWHSIRGETLWNMETLQCFYLFYCMVCSRLSDDLNFKTMCITPYHSEEDEIFNLLACS